MGEGRYPFPRKEEAIHTLERDVCFRKIPQEEIPHLIDIAWSTGVSAAVRFLEKRNRKELDFERIFREAGVSVRVEDRDYVSGRMRYFADLQPKAKRATVYRRSVALWAEKNGFSYAEAKNLILMHEYFHYLEHTELGFVSSRFHVAMIRLFGRGIGKTGIASLSEIAADGFANTVWREAFCEYGVNEKTGDEAENGEENERAL